MISKLNKVNVSHYILLSFMTLFFEPKKHQVAILSLAKH